VAAFGVGMFEVCVFRRFREIEKQGQTEDGATEAKRVRSAASLRAIPETLKNKRFVGYMIPTIFFYFMFHSGWPLFGILQVIVLEANELHMAINVAISGVCGFIGAGFWSRLINKKGNDLACFYSAIGLAAGMLLTSIAPNIYVYIAIQSIAGFSGVGIVITLLNGLLAATPDKNRVIYISVYNTFINISLGLSPFFAYAILDAVGIRPAMAIIGGGRIVAAGALFVIYLKSRKLLKK
jgi:predicted MFS family arabinose efflux permease